MNSKDLKSIAEGLLETFKEAGNESIKTNIGAIKNHGVEHLRFFVGSLVFKKDVFWGPNSFLRGVGRRSAQITSVRFV